MAPHARRKRPSTYLRVAWLGPRFLTLGLCEPRGSVCLGLGGCFLRASRFFFFRSALSLTDFVFTCRLLVHLCSRFAPLIPEPLGPASLDPAASSAASSFCGPSHPTIS